jgi:hypothetical protein
MHYLIHRPHQTVKIAAEMKNTAAIAGVLGRKAEVWIT